MWILVCQLSLLPPVPIAHLAPELLAEIAACAAQAPETSLTQYDWAAGAPTSNLSSLCLTSRVFREAATAHLYSHLVLPTAEAGRALIRTLKSDRWQTGEMAGKAGAWVKEVTFGQQAGKYGVADGAFVDEVLDQLEGAELERVAITGLALGQGLFGKLKGNSNQSRLPAAYSNERRLIHIERVQGSSIFN